MTEDSKGHSLPADGVGSSDDSSVTRWMDLVAKREHNLLSIMELARELSKAPDLYSLAQVGLLNICGQLTAFKGALWLRGEDGRLVTICAQGIEDKAAQAVGVTYGRNLLESVRAADRPTLVAQAEKFVGKAGVHILAQTEIVLVGAVGTGESPEGLVALGPRADGESFGPSEVLILQNLLLQFGVAIENVRERDRLREQLRQERRANTNLHEFASRAKDWMHEVEQQVRGPVGVISMCADTLHAGAIPKDEESYFVSSIEQQAAAIHEAMSDATSKLLWPNETENTTEVDITHWLKSFATERSPGVVGGLREFHTAVAANLGRQAWNEQVWCSILDELVDSAVASTSPGSRIELGASLQGGELVIWVEDSGPSLPAESCSDALELSSSTRAPFRPPLARDLQTIGRVDALIKSAGGVLELEANEPGRVRWSIRRSLAVPNAERSKEAPRLDLAS